MSLVDLAIVLIAVGFAVGGYRNGAVVGVLSLAGFFGGAIAGAKLARPIGSRLASGSSQVLVAILAVLAFAFVGQLVAVWIGARIRARLTWRPARAVDSSLGALFGVLSVLLVTWMVALPLAYSPYPAVNAAVRRSAIVRTVNDTLPAPVTNLYSSLRTYIDRSGFPPVLGDLTPTRIVAVAPPDPALAGSAVVSRVHSSVLQVEGDAPSCSRSIEGSSFVISPQHVLTNAHVVAGTARITVGGAPARVVLFDPKRDVAVLYVPGLSAPALPDGPVAGTNADAIVLGYPENGPYDARSARVRSQQEIDGHDIYGNGVVARQIYTVRGTVRPGNSGGPLVDPSGRVLGVVFATSLDEPGTGFVLTNAEVASAVATGRGATAAVATGSCTPD